MKIISGELELGAQMIVDFTRGKFSFKNVPTG